MKKLGWMMGMLVIMMLMASCGSKGEPEVDQNERETSSELRGEGGQNQRHDETEGRTTDEGIPSEAEITVVAEGLKSPWAITWDASDQVYYISERDGAIARVSLEGTVTRESLSLTKPVEQVGEGGLLGLALFPDFAESASAYAYYTFREQGALWNRIVVLVRSEAGEWRETREVLGYIPGERFHNGGRIKLGPDGMLYATTGDALVEPLSQDTESYAGKILRISPDGSVPADNPNEDASHVYSYGHRNPQGLAWTDDGMLFSSEHGPSGAIRGHDELNLILPGGNYGWPDIIGSETKGDMIPPLYHSGTTSIAPSGMTIDGDGNIIVTTLVGEKLLQFNQVGELQRVLVSDVGRLRDAIYVEGQGLLVITNNTDGRGRPRSGDDRLLLIRY